MRRNKFGAKKTTIEGITFDSKWESRRWQELRLLEKAGEITGLQRQVPFDIIVNGHHVCTYRADFCYSLTSTGERVVADAKSPATITPEFRLKAKLMEATFGIVVQIDLAKPSWSLDVNKGKWLRGTPPARSRKTTSRGTGSL